MTDPRSLATVEADLPTSSYAARRRQAARNILPFFRNLLTIGRSAKVAMDREKALLYLDALRTDFMTEVEADPAFDVESRIEIAKMVSLLAKGWPQILQLTRDHRQSDALIAVMYALAAGLSEISIAFGVTVEMRDDARR